jgi:hypothetical protein
MNAGQLPANETVETLAWNNRELLLRIYYQTVETNGSVRRLNGEVYGDPAHGELGLKRQVEENMAYREKMKVAMRIAWIVAGAALTTLITLLALILDHIL